MLFWQDQGKLFRSNCCHGNTSKHNVITRFVSHTGEARLATPCSDAGGDRRSQRDSTQLPPSSAEASQHNREAGKKDLSGMVLQIPQRILPCCMTHAC